MSDMIERVALAIRSGLENSGLATVQASGPNGEEGLRQLFEVLAMDAIEAMREPTDELADVMNRHAANGMVEWRDLHQAMIEAALK